MVETVCRSELRGVQIRIVWLASDWSPDSPVVLPWQAPFELTGVASPGLMSATIELTESEPVACVLRRVLTKQANAALAVGQVGVSVFGRRVRAGQIVYDGDRLELLGPIRADPKSDRRRLVNEQRANEQQASARRGMWNRKR